jgi:hypothetical protein
MGDDAVVAYHPQFLDGSPHTPTSSDAYVHVRVADHPRPTGAVTVYLPDGTSLVVPEHDLIRLAPADVAEIAR